MRLRKLVFCTILLVPALAAAQAAPGDTVAGDAAYQEGRRLYDLRDWDRAIEKFKQAYELRHDPASLFNVAQAYRLKGDCGEALAFYRTYARNFPDATNLDHVNEFIKQLEPCAAEQEKSTTMQPVGTVETAAVLPAAPEPPGDGGARRRRIGLIVTAGGGVVIGAALVVGALARSKWNQALDRCDDSFACDEGGIELGDQARRRATIATGLGAIGLAGVGAGLVVYLTAPSLREHGIAITPVVGPRDAGFAIGGPF